ncbi:Uncharacterised protein [Bifidobacterium adolescentis]|uniref:class I SAM-dependent methyltransferase n=1 Tax=Bifidobacterium adolescentis TaxID=1680 RepID=UPI000D925568|nr:methyltransferase domain-containing protein [Bifidobacterium adolescentis]SPU24704.1 Uncharacterised protein [Bifidobacterium adolescentis]
MAAIARKRGMDVQIATAETADLPEESYDVIYFNGSSSYIPDLKVAYGNVLKALKKGGSLVLLDVPKESAYGLLYLLAGKLDTYDSRKPLIRRLNAHTRWNSSMPLSGIQPKRKVRF